jgi:uncharacterized membrane-anchored protein YjiN (DUF445 family)
MTVPMLDDERMQALRRMKLVATGMLVGAAGVFAVCVIFGGRHGLWGYLQAAAEASMVGGLADWFAVTALFRYPMGIPIPHTAIIPRKKDQIGSALATFVQQNFLTESVVGERLAAAQVARRIGEWLANPQHAARVADEAGSALNGLADVIRDDEVRDAVAHFADRRLHEIQLAPLLARVLDAVRESGQHQAVLTAGLKGLMRFLDDNRTVFRERLSEESPDWVPVWVDDRVFARLFTGLQSFLADVSTQPNHELRKNFDRYLRDYAIALRTDPEKAASLEKAKIDLLERPDVGEWLSGLWAYLKQAILSGAADPNSDLRRTVESITMQVGTALRDDPGLQSKVDGSLQRLIGHVLARYSDDIAELISGTVARWDAADTGRRLELQVGRDLQFIRINGTVVGALVGVIIYAVTQVL